MAVNNAIFVPHLKGAPSVMRNYIMAFGINWNVLTFDDMHSPVDNFFVSEWGSSLDNLMKRVQSENDGITEGLPANWTAEFLYPTEPKKGYFLLDKNSLLHVLQTFPDQAYGDLAAAVSIQVFRNQVEDTPRYKGWKDAAGVERAPAPSDRKGQGGVINGAQKHFYAAKGLLAYSGTF